MFFASGRPAAAVAVGRLVGVFGFRLLRRAISRAECIQRSLTLPFLFARSMFHVVLLDLHLAVSCLFGDRLEAGAGVGAILSPHVQTCKIAFAVGRVPLFLSDPCMLAELDPALFTVFLDTSDHVVRSARPKGVVFTE